MEIREITAKSILTKSRLPESDYSINPYVGCMHGCVYCYARFMKRFTGHTEEWGEFVDVRVNAVDVLRRQLKGKKKKRGVVLFGSVCDAYQPLEKKHKLTRRMLEELKGSELSVSILTKSDLVLRDIDLLSQMANVTVGLSITTTDDAVRKLLEPRAASIERRIRALQVLHRAGVETYAFIGPIFPLFTDLAAIFARVHKYADSMWGEALNTRAGNWHSIENALTTAYPESVQEFKALAKSNDYWKEIEQEFTELCHDFQKPLAGFYRH